MAPSVSFKTRSPRKVAIGCNTRILVVSPDASAATWRLNNCDEARIRQRVLSGGVFVLDVLEVTKLDEGNIEVTLENDEGDRICEEFRLELLELYPEGWCCSLIRGLPGHVQLTRGADATLRTRFLANPKPEFTWLQNGVPIEQSQSMDADNCKSVRPHGDLLALLSGDSSELQLKAIGENSPITHFHICAIVDNDYGCDYRTVELTVWDAHERVSIEQLEKFAAQYVLEEHIIGTGRFGTVYTCQDKSSGRQVAAKIIKTITSRESLAVEREVEVLNRFRMHPKLLTLLGVYRGPKEMILVTEFVAGGELFERVVAEEFCLTEQDCVQFLRQILDAMDFVHVQNVLHLDLKPENILCTDASGYNIKIIDFGLAQHYDPSGDLRILFGTPEFVAPEVISYEPVSPKSDMWSIGVITYVLLSGLSPFMGDTDDQTFQNVISVDYEFDADAFEDISSEAVAFVKRLLVKEPTLRPSCEECLLDPWLSGDIDNPSRKKILINTKKLKSFVVRRKWLKGANVICALNRLGVFRSSNEKDKLLCVELPNDRE
ncbi:myosin light chain kinase family member 4-like isoform X2 [Varroa jacobsoni]|uniref:Protein kinase domain-containing protein n=1 Tax=Varroa destructor TaxID=109461 RepID=A0A7M7K898_VARDE|nr:myosin light chain kinase family member 4-like isoform X2 [Varroa destructor]XP_022708953.1 myosin light chain kinase family member 4-like isoform X2 [Varroa jacobsoni]